MNDIKQYWKNKDTKAQEAKVHTELMEKFNKKEIENSIEGTIEYEEHKNIELNTSISNQIPEFILDDIDSVSAIFKYKEDDVKMAVLNFASFKFAGGGFIKGSIAQEECLCHESFLYNVLSKKEDFYAKNRTILNDSLYKNRGLYSPDIQFSRKIEDNNIICNCNVITVAAPNKRAYLQHNEKSKELEEINKRYLVSRCNFVLTIAKLHNIKTLILGAFGCGVFNQDPEEVALAFRTLLEQYDYGVEKVIFAIPNKNDPNYQGFFKYFK